jgi:hypothetical protein
MNNVGSLYGLNREWFAKTNQHWVILIVPFLTYLCNEQIRIAEYLYFLFQYLSDFFKHSRLHAYLIYLLKEYST